MKCPICHHKLVNIKHNNLKHCQNCQSDYIIRFNKFYLAIFIIVSLLVTNVVNDMCNTLSINGIYKVIAFGLFLITVILIYKAANIESLIIKIKLVNTANESIDINSGKI